MKPLVVHAKRAPTPEGWRRVSREQAQAEAIRRAKAFVADRLGRDLWRHRGAFPNTLVSPSQASTNSKDSRGFTPGYGPHRSAVKIHSGVLPHVG